MGDGEHGMVNAFAFEVAVSEELPGLHAGKARLTRARTHWWERLYSCCQVGSSACPRSRRRGTASPGTGMAAVGGCASPADGP